MLPQTVTAYVLTALGGVLGAYLSNYTRHGGNALWHYANGVITIGSWAWLTKCSVMPLMITSAVWDVVYTVFFTATLFLLTGDELGPTQLVGVGAILVGLFLLGR